jgi:hypothetical protein
MRIFAHIENNCPCSASGHKIHTLDHHQTSMRYALSARMAITRRISCYLPTSGWESCMATKVLRNTRPV